MKYNKQRIVIITGPTAGGKSDLALSVTKHYGGEIINADSMQVYHHLDAGTAKPSAKQLATVTHHFINCVEPTQSWTVANWLDQTEKLIAKMYSRSVLPIVAGGTNLYIKSLLEGMFQGPATNENFRASLADINTQQLHEQLLPVDPIAAERIKPNDRKRIIRALEVFHATGKPISQLQKQWGVINEQNGTNQAESPYRYDPIMIGLRWPVETINRRINARVKLMFDPPDGSEDLISETKRLHEAGLLGPQAREAIGTRQVLAYLDDHYTRDKVIERVKIDTRRFAKQQRTWLKRYRNVHWFNADEHSPEELAKLAIEMIDQQY